MERIASESIYEIAYLDGAGDDALVLERAQLLFVDRVLRLRKTDGSEKPCEGDDAAAVISSTPSLREVRAGAEVRISCAPEVSANLPFILVPVLDGADPEECFVTVNGGGWMAFHSVAPKLANKVKKKLNNHSGCGFKTTPFLEDLSLEDQLSSAKGALIMMGLTSNFAPIVCILIK